MPVYDKYHPTELQAATYCPMKWYLGYFKNLAPAAHNWAKIRGTIGHIMLELEQYPRAALLAEVFEKYENGNDDGNHLTHAAPILYPNNIEKEIDDVEAMIKEYWKAVRGYGIKITDKEKRLECDILGRPFSGTVDAVALFPDTPHGEIEILDYKFGKRFHDNSLDRNLQFGIYYLMCRELGIKVNRFWWVTMQDLLPYKKNCKGGNKGDIRGQGFYPIRIVEQDVEYIETMVRGALSTIDIMSGKSQLHQSSYGWASPCNLCDFEAHCPKFQIGSREPFDVMVMSAKSQDQLEREMFNDTKNSNQ
jgi:hypothetical protein